MKLIDYINKHAKGFTLDLHTGKESTHKKGYFVFITSNVLTTDVEHQLDILLECVNTLNNLNPDCKYYISGWKEDSKYYVDITVWAESLVQAVTTGMLFKQLAIWDIKAKQSITL